MITCCTPSGTAVVPAFTRTNPSANGSAMRRTGKVLDSLVLGTRIVTVRRRPAQQGHRRTDEGRWSTMREKLSKALEAAKQAFIELAEWESRIA